jgi:hypothetical protein
MSEAKEKAPADIAPKSIRDYEASPDWEVTKIEKASESRKPIMDPMDAIGGDSDYKEIAESTYFKWFAIPKNKHFEKVQEPGEKKALARQRSSSDIKGRGEKAEISTESYEIGSGVADS